MIKYPFSQYTNEDMIWTQKYKALAAITTKRIQLIRQSHKFQIDLHLQFVVPVHFFNDFNECSTFWDHKKEYINYKYSSKTSCFGIINMNWYRLGSDS